MSGSRYERVRKQWQKLMSKMRGDFNSSKCKTWARMTTARIKLLRNKREALVRQMRRDIAMLLESRQDATARIRVEHVMREQNMMAANEILQLFCDRLVTRLSIISKQRECPSDLKEAISSLIFAAPRCSDIPELLSMRHIFLNKYGHDFVSAASDLRPDSGVNRLLVEKLSALNPPGELKLKVIKEIAKEYQVEWDTTETEAELLKPPEDRLDGPCSFVSAASLPLNAGLDPFHTKAHKPTTRLSSDGTDLNFHDVASAAKAAADSAKNAVAAAKAAARLSRYARSNVSQQEDDSRRYSSLQSLDGDKGGLEDMGLNTRHASCNVHCAHSDIMFDDSDRDEDIHMERPTADVQQKVDSLSGMPGASPSTHRKLPDYDVIAARFEELRYRKT